MSGGDVASHEARPRERRHLDHGVDQLEALLGLVGGHLRQHDLHLLVMVEIVERRHQVPAVHLALVDLLRAVIEAGGVAQAHRVGGGEDAERGMRPHHAVLIEQGELAVDLEDALDHEHHVGAVRRRTRRRRARSGCCSAQGSRPSRNSVTWTPSRITIASLPIRSIRLMWLSRLMRMQGQLRRAATCSDVGRLPGAVIALDHHPAVVGEAGENGERGVAIEAIRGVDVRHVVGGLRERRHFHVGVDAERLADGKA